MGQLVIGEREEVQLWSFKAQLRDRRDGNQLECYAVISGNGDYEIEAAEAEIRARAGALGYDLLECELTEERIFTYDTVALFETATPSSDMVKPKKRHVEPEPADEEPEPTQAEIMAAALAEAD